MIRYVKWVVKKGERRMTSQTDPGWRARGAWTDVRFAGCSGASLTGVTETAFSGPG